MNNRSWLPQRELFENICMASRETDEKFKGGRRTKGRMLAGAELRSAAQNSARSSRMRRLNGHDCFSRVTLIINTLDHLFLHPMGQSQHMFLQKGCS